MLRNKHKPNQQQTFASAQTHYTQNIYLSIYLSRQLDSMQRIPTNGFAQRACRKNKKDKNLVSTSANHKNMRIQTNKRTTRHAVIGLATEMLAGRTLVAQLQQRCLASI
jgi:tRNA A37 threonylcarbamoyladenosine synthetase subunit TsaC/SUA5/YrdC